MMKTPIALNSTVVCQKSSQLEEDQTLIVYSSESLPIYKILDIGKALDDTRFSVGDNIIVNSTGTKVHLEGNIYYIFKVENIIGKVED